MFSALCTEYISSLSRFEEMQWPRISFISIRNGWTITRGEASDLNVLSFLLTLTAWTGISPSFTLQRASATKTYEKNTTIKWSIGSIYKPLLTGGGITLIEVGQ